MRVEPASRRSRRSTSTPTRPTAPWTRGCRRPTSALDAFVDKNALVAWANSLARRARRSRASRSRSCRRTSRARRARTALARIAFDQASSKSGTHRLARRAPRRRRGDYAAVTTRRIRRRGGRRPRGDIRACATQLALVRLRRPQAVSARRGGERQGLDPPRRPDADAATSRLFNAARRDRQLRRSKTRRATRSRRATTKLNALAGFDLKLKLPPTMNLGGAPLEFKLARRRRASTRTLPGAGVPPARVRGHGAAVSEAPHFVGAHATVTVDGATTTRAAGSPAPRSSGTSRRADELHAAESRRLHVRQVGSRGGRAMRRRSCETQTSSEFKGRTDAEGRHTLRMDFDGGRPAAPVERHARRRASGREPAGARRRATTLLVHPSEVYVGLRPARTFVQQGEAFDVDAIVTDLDGKRARGARGARCGWCGSITSTRTASGSRRSGRAGADRHERRGARWRARCRRRAAASTV